MSVNRQITQIFDGANAIGPSEGRKKDLHCPLMRTHGFNYWEISCINRQSHDDNNCPNSCEHKSVKRPLKKQRRW